MKSDRAICVGRKGANLYLEAWFGKRARSRYDQMYFYVRCLPKGRITNSSVREVDKEKCTLYATCLAFMSLIHYEAFGPIIS